MLDEEMQTVSTTCITDETVFQQYANCCLVSGEGSLNWYGIEDTTAMIHITVSRFAVLIARNFDNGEKIFAYLKEGLNEVCAPVGLFIFVRSDCPFDVETDCAPYVLEQTGNPLCVEPNTNYIFRVNSCFDDCEWLL